MNREPVIEFAEQYLAPDDYLYLLVDGLAECAASHPLSVSSLTGALGATAVARVPRPDISHTLSRCPALIQLAAPGQSVALHYLELGADYAQRDLVYNERYICGWLASPQPLDVVAAHLAARCETTASEDGRPSPWYEPLRLELLLGALGDEAGDLLSPIRYWLFPISWGGYTLIRSTDYPSAPTLAQTARESQQVAPIIHRLLGLWRHAVQRPPRFAPWRWTGASVLPPQAAVHGFRLIREARRLGLSRSRDLVSLSLHQVFYHPHLPKHPEIQQAIAMARAGSIDLQSHFAGYSEDTWRNIVADLPRAKDYS